MIIPSALEMMAINSQIFREAKDILDIGDQGLFNKEHGEGLLGIPLSGSKFDQVTQIYRHYDCSRKVAELKPGYIKVDLNKSISGAVELHSIADIVTNHGTSEHIFNQVTLFEAMHLMTRQGGYMFHSLNCQGWADGNGLGHGFYLYQPKFVELLAKANDYDIVDLKYNPSSPSSLLVDFEREKYPQMVLPTSWKWPNDTVIHFSSLLVILKKKTNDTFKIPNEY